MKNYFISFGTRKGNLGVVITRTNTPKLALEKVTKLGLNQGGEAAIFRISDKEFNELPADRLISPTEMRQFGYLSTYQTNTPRQEILLGADAIVCSGCNDKLAN